MRASYARVDRPTTRWDSRVGSAAHAEVVEGEEVPQCQAKNAGWPRRPARCPWPSTRSSWPGCKSSRRPSRTTRAPPRPNRPGRSASRASPEPGSARKEASRNDLVPPLLLEQPAERRLEHLRPGRDRDDLRLLGPQPLRPRPHLARPVQLALLLERRPGDRRGQEPRLGARRRLRLGHDRRASPRRAAQLRARRLRRLLGLVLVRLAEPLEHAPALPAVQ